MTRRDQTKFRIAALVAALVVATAIGVWLAIGRSGSQRSSVTWSMLPNEIGRSHVTAATLNGNGAVALGTAGGTVRLIRPGRPRRERLIARGRQIRVLTVSDDASTVAGIAGEDMLWAWHVASNQLQQGRAPYAGEVVALTRNGRRLAAGGFDIDVYDLSTGTVHEIRPQPRPGGSTTYADLVFGRRARTVVAAAHEGVDFWDAESGRRLRPALDCTSCGADGVALSRDGRFVAYGTSDAHVLLWNVQTRRLVLDRTVTTVRGDHVYGVAVTPDGSRVAAGTASGLVVTYDARTRAEVDRLRLRKQVRPVGALALTDDGRTLLVQENELWLVHLR
jgi:WD40 repeat protein